MMTKLLEFKQVEVDGIKFTRDRRTGYYLSSKNINGKRKRLHVYVWEKNNGPVPKGCHVHHLDENKDNNSIENLKLLSASDHEYFHGKERLKKNKEWNAKFQQEGQKHAKEWHKSKEGHEWHKKQYQLTKNKLQKKYKKICICCGKEFLGSYKAKYCSNNCKSKARRATHKDDEERICIICGKSFKTNKYSKAKTCSKECRVKLFKLHRNQ